jgi:uncharacterized membrane protein YhaH (DUF805 family)
MRSKIMRLHQGLIPVLILLPLLLVGCERWGQSGRPGVLALVPPLLVVVAGLIVLVRDQ